MPSSVIHSMRYRSWTRTLDICFRDGRGLYRYFDVPPEEWQRFRDAPSKGTYLNQMFKAGGYGYEKLDQPTESDGLTKNAAPAAGCCDEDLFWGQWPQDQ